LDLPPYSVDTAPEAIGVHAEGGCIRDLAADDISICELYLTPLIAVAALFTASIAFPLSEHPTDLVPGRRPTRRPENPARSAPTLVMNDTVLGGGPLAGDLRGVAFNRDTMA
jgi:hypothetical protein